jgi:hypothetical protein
MMERHFKFSTSGSLVTMQVDSDIGCGINRCFHV